MATNEAVISYFRGISGVSELDAPESLLSAWMTPVILQHDPAKTVTTLASTEIHAVALLLWVKYHLYRASILSESFPSSETGIGYTDQSRSMQSHLQIADEIRRDYEKYTSRLGLGVGGIQVSHFVQYQPETDSYAPMASVRAPVPSTLSGSVESGVVTLTWTEPPISDFLRYDIYSSLTAGIADPGAISAPGSKLGVYDTATLVKSLSDRWKTLYRVSGLGVGTYYFLIVTVNQNGRFSVSNEIAVAVE